MIEASTEERGLLPDTTRLTIDLSVDFHRELKVRAAAEGVSVAPMTRALYRLWLDDADLRARVSDVMPRQP